MPELDLTIFDHELGEVAPQALTQLRARGQALRFIRVANLLVWMRAQIPSRPGTTTINKEKREPLVAAKDKEAKNCQIWQCMAFHQQSMTQTWCTFLACMDPALSPLKSSRTLPEAPKAHVP